MSSEYRMLQVGKLPPNSQSAQPFWITREWAQWALDTYNWRNRKPTMSRVEQYAGDMADGKWDIMPSGISFSLPVAKLEDGKITIEKEFLTNGQNRLLAVVMCGKPVVMRVFVGCEPRTQNHEDGHQQRRPHQMFELEGRKDIGRLGVAVANAMRIGPVGELTGLSLKLSDSRLMEFVNNHEKAIKFAIESFRPFQKKITTAPVIAVIARAFYTEDHATLRQFAKVLSSGNRADGDVAAYSVLKLRDHLKDRKTTTGNQEKVASFQKTQRVLEAYINGETLDKVYACGKDLFPMPRKKEPGKAA